ncbi:MAG: PAS domain S-box protein, partial [Prolixibacteraceae bacterium]|nr:PAS domain S-box protein [Prolixibacteraceae bacterium]
HFYQVSLNPIVEGDNITGVSAISIEITDRVLAENKIFESEEKFRTLVGNLQGAAYRCNYDKSWTMQFLSGQIEKLTGYPANEFIKNRVRAYASIIHPGDRKMVESKVNAAIAKKEHFSIEHRIINANGNILWVIENGQGVFDEKNKVICIDGVLFDITERKKAENALHENEKKMRSLLNNLNAGIVVHAPNTSITFSNPRASELLGLSVEQMLGKKAIDPDWNFLDEKSNPLPPGEYPVNKIISAKKPIKNMSAGVVHSKTDDISWLLVNGFPVLNENGEITEIIINFIDITEVKIAEGELNKYREHLEELIKKRTQQLENKNAKLLRINKAFVGRELRMAELKKEIEKLKGNREVG